MEPVDTIGPAKIRRKVELPVQAEKLLRGLSIGTSLGQKRPQYFIVSICFLLGVCLRLDTNGIV